MKLPVFPLPVFLLPDGVTRLRVFEPRYIKLVSIATQEQGFALTVYAPELPHQVSPCAAWVDIVDFYEENGVLHIDVKAKSLVSLTDVTMDDDQLRFAYCEPIAHWQGQAQNEKHSALSCRLQDIFEEHVEIASLYPEPQFDSPTWVCSRYIELLPLSMEQKQTFVKPTSFSDAQSFIHTFMFGE